MARSRSKKPHGPRKGWTPEALARRERAIGRNPWGGYNHNNLGCEFFRMCAWGHAVAEFERAVEINPWQAYFKANLARAYLVAGDLKKAEIMVAQALRQNATLAQTHFAAALIEEARGQMDAAIASYQKCLFLKPSLAIRRDVEENLNLLLEERKSLHKNGDRP